MEVKKYFTYHPLTSMRCGCEQCVHTVDTRRHWTWAGLDI